MDVHGPVEHLGLVLAVDGIEQLVAGEDAAVGLDQGRQQAELDARQRDRLAVAGDLEPVGIDDEVGERDRLRGSRRRSVEAVGRPPAGST